jgi:hypothetical protein
LIGDVLRSSLGQFGNFCTGARIPVSAVSICALKALHRRHGAIIKNNTRLLHYFLSIDLMFKSYRRTTLRFKTLSVQPHCAKLPNSSALKLMHDPALRGNRRAHLSRIQRAPHRK